MFNGSLRRKTHGAAAHFLSCPRQAVSQFQLILQPFSYHYTATTTRRQSIFIQPAIQVPRILQKFPMQRRGRSEGRSATPRHLTGSPPFQVHQLFLPWLTHTLEHKDRVAQCNHPLAFSAHWSTLLAACPLPLRLFLNSKSQAYKIEQQKQQNSLWTTYCICHRFSLLNCLQIPMGPSITIYSVMAGRTYQRILALSRCQVH